MRKFVWLLLLILPAAGGCRFFEEMFADPNSIEQVGEAATAVGTAIVPFNLQAGLIVAAAGGLIITLAAFIKRIESSK